MLNEITEFMYRYCFYYDLYNYMKNYGYDYYGYSDSFYTWLLNHSGFNGTNTSYRSPCYREILKEYQKDRSKT
jgi:hypothetical protein